MTDSLPTVLRNFSDDITPDQKRILEIAAQRIDHLRSENSNLFWLMDSVDKARLACCKKLDEEKNWLKVLKGRLEHHRLESNEKLQVKNDIFNEARAESSRVIVELSTVLRELVQIADIKDGDGNRHDYERLMPEAWEGARAALSRLTTPAVKDDQAFRFASSRFSLEINSNGMITGIQFEEEDEQS